MTSEYCKVCGQLGQGNHFGVISCRACAVFFRRAADSKWSKMECLSRHCDGKSYHCKPCRLKRCRAVGMDTSKFQHDRDSIVVCRKRKLPVSFESVIGRPHIVLFFPDPSPSKKTFIDLTNLISKAEEIMRSGCESPLVSRSHLGKLCYAVKWMNMEKKPRFVESMTRAESSGLWEFYLLTTARWLTYFEPFQELEEPMKIQLLLGTWHVWSRLHKLIATALYRNRTKNAKSTERITGDGLLTDISKPKADVEWMSRYSSEQVTYFLEGLRVGDLFAIIDNFETMALSEMEMTFMMAQLCFQYASGRFGGRTSEVMERFQEILATDLHTYYTEERNMIRYSGRLLKMLKINKDIQENIRKHRARGDIAKTFEIFSLNFSHPEMFHDTGLN